MFTPSIRAIYDNNGFISTFAGDAFTSIFPYKYSKPIFAVNAARQIQKIFNLISKQKTKFGEYNLFLKIGLSYGNVNWGIIKNDKLNSYYFKGDAIYNCAKSEYIAEKGEVIFDKAFFQKIQSKVLFEEKSKGYYLLKSISKVEKPLINQTSPKRLSNMDFIPEPILKLKTKGEFRDIISCFISFEENRNWKKITSKIIELTRIYDGYFDKIDFGDKGGNILVLFGAPVGKEKIFKRACDFALAVRNLPNFQIRIGLTYGTVFAGFIGSKLRAEYTALGMVVNLSARYMMKANSKEIFIDRFINKNIKNMYLINELPEQKFKGFDEKIPVYLLEKKKEYKTIFESKLIGRQKELQKLKSYLKPTQNHKFGGIVYVHGIAGIGKSRLVHELKNRVILSEVEESKKNYNWFYLPCDEILRKSFNPFSRFLKDYFEQSEENTKKINKSNFDNKLENIIKKTKDKEIKREFIRTKSILGAMMNLHWKNSLYEQLDAKGRFENSLYAVKNLIKAESLQIPVIIEPEDGHWIDTDSQKLMEVLTRNVEKYPITIISSCRLKDDSSLFDFNLKEVPEKNIILEHLEKDSSRKLVEDILQGKVSDAFFYLIWQKSEGNPFYIEQIILFLLENDLIDVKMNLTERDIKIPKTINSIIVARIDRLTTELKELVQTASVLGREFAVNILSEMLNKKEINKELTEGEDENIWNALTEINYIFKHALIRETVYEMQLKKNLSELHKLAAETIENIYIKDLRLVYGELVNHYEKAEIKTKAIEYLKKAGDYAKEHYQNELAIEFYDRMLDNLQGLANLRSLEIDILLKKGEIMELIGKWKETEKIYRKALILSEEIKDKKRIAKSYGSYGSQQRLKGNYNKAKEFYEKQLEICERLEDKNGISVAVGNMGLVNMDHGKYKKAMDCYIKGLKICEELGNKHGISIVIGNMGILYYFQNSYEKSIECFKKKLKICEKLGDKRGAMIVNGNIGNVYQLQGRYKKAITCHKKQLKSSEELGDIKGISIAVGNIGSVHKDQGIYTKAMECYQQKLKICKKLGDKRGISVSTCRIGIIYENNGNYRKAMEYYIKDLKICEELNDRRGTTRGIGNLGDIYYYQGNYEKAIECYVKLLTISTELGDKNGISVAVGNKGNVYMNQGNYKKAIECYKKAINIKNELGLKQSLIYPLSSKAKCLYKMWEYRKAKECNEKCATVAKELESKKQIFLSAVLKEKINFKLAESFQSRSQNNENLKLLLRDEKEEENIAELNYEIALMLNEMRKDYSKYKNKSISIYKRLYKKTPNIDYKNRIEELEKL